MDERNSVQVANELIEMHNSQLANTRHIIVDIDRDIRETKKRIEKLEEELAETREYLNICEEELADNVRVRKDHLIELMALKMFVNNGGGLDMFVD